MSIEALFEGHHTLRAVIDCVIEGNLGRLDLDDSAAPRVARAELGCYSVLGGTTASPKAQELVATAAGPELIVPDDQAWRDLLVAVHGDRLEDRPMRTFSPHALERDHLRRLATQVPSGFTIERLNTTLAKQLDADLHPHALQTFTQVADFEARGAGFGAVFDGKLASASTSYAFSKERIEISISTRSEFRGQRLATATAASMLLYCLDQGVRPQWAATNPISKQLALRLGFRPGAICDVFYLTDRSD